MPRERVGDEAWPGYDVHADDEPRAGGGDRFDFCAECLGSFITDNLGRGEHDEELPLGFTVSSGLGFGLQKATTASDAGHMVRSASSLTLARE